jgi:hypothetical protein
MIPEKLIGHALTELSIFILILVLRCGPGWVKQKMKKIGIIPSLFCREEFGAVLSAVKPG